MRANSRSMILAFGWALAVSGHAHELPVENLDALADSADMIFQGRVTKIEYGQADSQGSPVPHTFVTYRVGEALKGRSAGGEELTLRFIGGPATEENLFLHVTGVPTFDEGDEDLVFVKNNGRSECPLAGCSEGRFRLIDDKVYSEDGDAVLLTPSGRIAYGRRNAPAEVRTWRVAGVPFGYADVDEADPAEPVDAPGRGNPLGRPIRKGEMRDLVRSRVNARVPEATLRNLPPVASMRARDRFSYRGPAVLSPPPAHDPPPTSGPALTEEDRRELEALQRRGGNPVLGGS